MRLPDGPRTPPLLQTLQLIARPTKFLDDCSQRYGNTFTLRVLGLNSPPVVFLAHPQAIQDVQALPSRQLDFGKATHVFRPLMGDRSVILQEGRSHQRQRHLLMPPFHGDRMKAYGQMICQIAQEVTKHLRPGEPFSIHPLMSDITLQIILQVVFGITPGKSYEQLRELLSALLEDITTPLFSSLFFFPVLQQDLGVWSPWGNFLQRRQQIDNIIYAEITRRRLDRQSSRTDILTMLISARDDCGQPMTDVELRDQLVSLLLLGYETTSAALAWAFYLIHSHASVVTRLRQELKTLGNEPNPEALSQLPYLTAVCQETLRIYPIALICTPRMVKEPLQLGDYEFDYGTVLVPCIYLAHQRPEIYPNPHKFEPERFLERKFSPFEYLPFGGGSRGCIGAAFSMFEMKLVLGTILSCFELALASQRPVYPVRRGITIVPSGIRMFAIDR
jgi:cytochrome P450